MIPLKVNGVERSFDGDPDLPLLWYLRDVLGLTGTKFGCGMALCGACTVHRDGKAIRSCVTNMSTLSGKEITTIEAMSKNGLHPVQQKWIEFNVPQCGYCQSGTDHAGDFPVERKTQAQRRGYRWRHGGKYLPVRNLPADSSGDQSRRGRERMSDNILNVSRRGFLQGVVSTGALILSVRLVPDFLWAAETSFTTYADRAILHPSAFVGIDTDGTVTSGGAPLGDGYQQPHFRPAHPGRRTGCGLEAGETGAGDRRCPLWRSGHRRIAFRSQLSTKPCAWLERRRA